MFYEFHNELETQRYSDARLRIRENNYCYKNKIFEEG